MNSRPVCLLSFDVEDYFQTENLRSAYPINFWDQQPLRVVNSTHKIFEILSRHNVKATFFVLGWIARRVPQLVREIVAAGHELASHGSSHVLPIHQEPAEFRRDVRDAKILLEDISGVEVRGYRAPSYAIDDLRLKLLIEEGYKYDSSYNAAPIHDRYGKLSAFARRLEGGVLEIEGGGVEVPLPVARLAGLKIPISGGGWFRLLPKFVFLPLALRFARENGYYLIYLHPWEFDPDQPRVGSEVRFWYRFRHYHNLEGTAEALERLIDAFKSNQAEFLTIGEYVNRVLELNKAR